VPDLPGADLCITSNEAFYLSDLPKRVAVVGGGYIAVEFAGIFNGLGAETHLVYRGDLVLRGFDVDVRATLSDELRKSGIQVHYNAKPAAVEKREQGLALVLRDGAELVVDQVMMATGRVPNSQGLGLDVAGVDVDPESGAIPVDAYSRTNVEHTYAVGDVTDRMALTPVAIKPAISPAAAMLMPAAIRTAARASRPAIFSHAGRSGLRNARTVSWMPLTIAIRITVSARTSASVLIKVSFMAPNAVSLAGSAVDVFDLVEGAVSGGPERRPAGIGSPDPSTAGGTATVRASTRRSRQEGFGRRSAQAADVILG